MSKKYKNMLIFLCAIYILYFIYSNIEQLLFIPVTLTLICFYVLVYFIDVLILRGKLSEWGTGKSFNNMSKNEWYRLVTCSFFHMNVLHLMGNVFGISFVGAYLEETIGSGLFLLIYILGNLLVYFLFSAFSTYTHGTGASPGIFALIACILYLYIQQPQLFDPKGSYQTMYIILYATLGNLIGLSGTIAHVFGFIIGLIMSILLF